MRARFQKVGRLSLRRVLILSRRLLICGLKDGPLAFVIGGKEGEEATHFQTQSGKKGIRKEPFLFNKKTQRGGKENEKNRITSISVGDFGMLGG